MNMNQKTLNIIYGIVIVVLIGTVVYFAVRKKSEPIAQQPTLAPTQEVQTPSPVTTPTLNPSPTPTPIQPPINETANWLTFKSSFFTLSFKTPSGFEVKEGQNYILVAKSPFFTTDIGSDNAFFRLTRYNSDNTRESRLTLYRKLLTNIQESMVIVDNSSFLVLKGNDWGRFEGDSAGKVTIVFFDASWLEIIERPANSNQSFNPITIGNQILSTFRFSK
jgi:hypothetical protein